MWRGMFNSTKRDIIPSSELMRCPFCGGDAIGLRTHYDYVIKCQCCTAQTSFHKTEEDAKAAWNRRVQG